MADRRQALKSLPELRRFLLRDVRPTGRTLGVGAYGSVEEVEVSGLLCAGKKIHEVLVNNQAVQNVAQKYVAECELMSELQHPNIVQFLGLCFLESSTLPVLVMEKPMTCLDELLESTPSIPLSVKKLILMDVAKGLIYLHSREPSPIIHRDLSAKNILLDSSLTAKISDLGNSRIVDFLPGQLACTLSHAPGTTVYMPPEALEERARYGPSLDIFSFGHLSLFTLTQVFPGDLLRHTYPDPHNRRRLIARSEVQRRQSYFTRLYQQLGEGHPLVQLVMRCLDDDSEYRPTAVDVHQRLNAMEIEDPYQHLTKLDMIRLLQEQADTQRDEEIQQLQTQLQQMQLDVAENRTQRDNSDGIILEKDEIIRERDESIRWRDAVIQRLQADVTEKDRALERAVQEKDCVIQQQDQLIRAGEELIRALQNEVRQKKEYLLHPTMLTSPKEGARAALESVALHKRRSWPWKQGEQDHRPRHTKTQLHFQKLKDLPKPMTQAQAVIYRGTLYVGGGVTPDNHFILCAYNFRTDTWDAINTITKWYALAVYQEQLVLAGGCHHDSGPIPTNELWLTNNQQHTFKQTIASMITPARDATAVTTQTHLIIAGGHNGHSYLNTIQIYNGNHWALAEPLPIRTCNIKYTIYNSRLYFIGGINQINGVFYASLPSLLQTKKKKTIVWNTLAATPLTLSSIVVLQSQLVVIGGYPASQSLYLYSDKRHRWERMATLPQPLYCTCSITLTTGELLIIGGWGTDGRSACFYKAATSSD